MIPHIWCEESRARPKWGGKREKMQEWHEECKAAVGGKKRTFFSSSSLTFSVSKRCLSASSESLCVFHQSVKSMVWSLCQETQLWKCGIACFKDCGGRSSQTNHHPELVGFVWSQSSLLKNKLSGY